MASEDVGQRGCNSGGGVSQTRSTEAPFPRLKLGCALEWKERTFYPIDADTFNSRSLHSKDVVERLQTNEL